MKTVFDKKEDCCGCTACVHICPTNAIRMEADEEGFLYPKINQKLCIDCGICRETCAFQKGYDTSQNFEKPYSYGVKHKDGDVQMKSRSGGMFTAISDLLIDSSGIVYGAGYNGDFEVCHKKANSRRKRNEFRGSKYVQSNLGDVFKDLEHELANGKKILFSGTPCQTAGLSKYLFKKGISSKNLLTCDIVCHGVPSPKLFKDYKQFLEKKHKGKLSDFNFRNKRLFGWEDHQETFAIKGRIYSSKTYTNLFYEHSSLRPSCYNCKYTNLMRPSDITLADFWGVDEVLPGFNDNMGASLVFVNTKKGKERFNEAKLDLIYKDCTGSDFIHYNLKEPTKKPANREKFWTDYNSKGFEFIIKRYGGYNIKNRSKKTIINLLKRFKLYEAVKSIRRDIK